jgi:hypothetical protein
MTASGPGSLPAHGQPSPRRPPPRDRAAALGSTDCAWRFPSAGSRPSPCRPASSQAPVRLAGRVVTRARLSAAPPVPRRQDLGVDVVVTERLLVPAQAEPAQPSPDVHPVPPDKERPPPDRGIPQAEPDRPDRRAGYPRGGGCPGLARFGIDRRRRGAGQVRSRRRWATRLGAVPQPRARGRYAAPDGAAVSRAASASCRRCRRRGLRPRRPAASILGGCAPPQPA